MPLRRRGVPANTRVTATRPANHLADPRRPGTFVQITSSAASPPASHGARRRAQVSTPAVTSGLRTVKGVKIGYDAVAGFHHRRARRAAARGRRQRAAGAKGVLIDMRNNGGGLPQRGRAPVEHLHRAAAASSARRAACRERTGSTTPPAEH